MASDYWLSTQAQHWTFTRDELSELRKTLKTNNGKLHNKFRLPDDRHMSIYLQQQLIKLGKRMSIRQQALATALIYIRRFYTQIEIRRTNPYLVISTALYLACKTEECPVHIKLILAESQRQWPDFEATFSISKIGECEFYIISTLKSRLVLHHPYRTLIMYAGEMGNSMSAEESALAWSVVNDSFNTDLPLLYAPHIIAFAAMFLSVTLRPVAQTKNGMVGGTGATFQGLSAMTAKSSHKEQSKIQRLVDFFAESDVDIEAVAVVVQELFSLYDIWELYSEKPCREAFTRILKEGPGGDMMV